MVALPNIIYRVNAIIKQENSNDLSTFSLLYFTVKVNGTHHEAIFKSVILLEPKSPLYRSANKFTLSSENPPTIDKAKLNKSPICDDNKTVKTNTTNMFIKAAFLVYLTK